MVEQRWVRLNVHGKWLEGSATDPQHYHWMPMVYNSSVRTADGRGETDFFLAPDSARRGRVTVAIAETETAAFELSVRFATEGIDLHAVQMAMSTPGIAVNIDLSGVTIVSTRPRSAGKSVVFEFDIDYKSIEVITVLKTSKP